jgi:hypothetical protein
MDIKIKYIPDIFPSVDFEIIKRLGNYQFKQIKPEITNYYTSERWQIKGDATKTKRLKQSIYVPRYELKFVIYENSDVFFVEQTDFAQIETSDGVTLDIFDANLEYSEIGTRKYQVTLKFSVRKLANITDPVAHDNVKNRTDKNKITAWVTKKFWAKRAEWTGSRLEFDIDTNEVKPEAGEYYYLHTFHANIPNNSVIKIISNPGRTIRDVWAEFVTDYPSAPDAIISDIVLDDVPESEVNVNVETYKAFLTIYTLFELKDNIDLSYKESAEVAGRQYTTDKISKTQTKVLFFLKSQNLNLVKLLVDADWIVFGGSFQAQEVANNDNYEIISKPENEMTDLHEFTLTFNNQIDV